MNNNKINSYRKLGLVDQTVEDLVLWSRHFLNIQFFQMDL